MTTMTNITATIIITITVNTTTTLIYYNINN